MTMSKKKKCLFCDKLVGEAQLPQHLSSFHAIDPTAFDDILDLEDDNDVVSRPPQQLERDDEDTAPESAADEDSKAAAEQPPDADATEDTTVPEEKEATTNMATEIDAESWTEQCLWECKACEFRCRSASIARAHCIEEHGEKVSAETRSSIESAVTNLEDKVKGDDKPALDAAMKQLSDASLELGKAVYEATSAEAGQAEAGPAGDSEGGSGADDEVIDAEFEVKDEK